MKIIQLNQRKGVKGFVSKVDDEDYEILSKYKWHTNKSKSGSIYARSGIGFIHRLVMKANKGQIIDHVDRDGLNNQKSNLRFCNRSQNACNKKSKQNGTSKYFGVYRQLNYNWISRITYNRRLYYLGTFKIELNAALAYNKKAIELHGEFARLNIIKKATL